MGGSEELAKALEPFCGPGGGPELQAFHDLGDDIIVWKNSGQAVTAGDVRRAREALAKHQGVPVSMMHFRRPLIQEDDAIDLLRADLEAVAGALRISLVILRRDCLERPGAGSSLTATEFGRLLDAWEIQADEALSRPGVKAVLDQATSRATATSDT